MAHRTFISYKHSESVCWRDSIIALLGKDQALYRGEDQESPDLSQSSEATIEKYLHDLIFPTSVTILLLSPGMFSSQWMPRELEYSLRTEKRSSTSSRPNGVIGVITPDQSLRTDWIDESLLSGNSLKRLIAEFDSSTDARKFASLILSNRDNLKDPNDSRSFSKSYIDFVDYKDFCNNPSSYIDNAYFKSLMADVIYDLQKQL